jgi:hypothetical protein
MTVAEVVSHRQKLDKLRLVVEAIVEAKEINPKDRDITVFITNANGLTSIYPEELHSILLKLQNDEKILTIKSFPDWLLESPGSNQSSVVRHVDAIFDPSKKNFIVRTFKKFDRFAVRRKDSEGDR